MRKAIYLGAALAAVISTSCSNDMEQPVAAGGDGNVAIRLQLPKQFSTRAFGDGLTATRLQYAVYHSGEKTSVITGKTQFNGLEATVNLNLVNGVTYDFVFWADEPENTFYTFDADEQTVTVDYDGLAGSDETRDAFFGQLTGQSITGPTSLSATLKRPFAQINLGTSDFNEDAVKAAYGDNFTSSMTISTKLPDTLDLITGDVSGEVETVATTSAAAPSGETFPVSGYDYVSMNYILVGSDKEVVDLSFSFSNDVKEVAELPVAMVPVQRNYRTNIYGAILTSPTDLKITIDPIFNTPDNNIEVWDGKTVIEPEADENGVYQIKSAAHLAGLAKMVTDGDNFEKKTVVLNSNIDMGGNILKIGEYIYKESPEETISHPFKGEFDGNGFTISNFKTNEANEIQARFGTGLFPVLHGTVKNLAISGAQVGNLANSGITYGNVNGIVAGYLYGYLQNVTVEDCIIYGYGKVGGLAGMFEGNDNQNNRILNCKVTNCTIIGKYNVSQGVGLSHSPLAMVGCEFSGNKLEHEDNLITVDPVIAVYTKQTAKPASVLSGQYVHIGAAYYSTAGTYYNYSGFDDYGIMIDGVSHVVDGAPVNDLNGFIELPADLAKVSDTYNELYKSGNEYYLSSANGLKQLNDLWNASSNRSGILYGTTVNIMADIDASGKIWNSFFATPDSNYMEGFTFDGNGHTISNLAIVGTNNQGTGLFNGTARGGFTTNPALFKDLTMKNCSSIGTGYHVGIIGGQIYGDIALQNVKVLDCTVSGNCNVGGMIGSTTVESSSTKASATFTDCEVSGCTLSAEGRDGCDPTGASAYVGRALTMGGNTSIITLNNSVASDNNFNNNNNLAGGGLWSSATYDNGWKDVVTHN